MAEPERQTFRLPIGGAKTLVVAMDTPPEGGVASWAVRFRLRNPRGVVLLEKSSGDGVTVTDADAGEWEVEIVGGETDWFKKGVADWSFWRTDVDSENPLALGTCEIYQTADQQ